MPKRSSLRQLSTPLLPWTPPVLESPRIVTVTSDPSTRVINLNPGEDCLIQSFEEIGYVPHDKDVNEDAIITVVGGRNVIATGLYVNVGTRVQSVLSVGIGADDMVVTVPSTATFPSSGTLRIDGEGIDYSSKTATTFIVSARRTGFYLGTATLPNTPHAAGATVYLGEYTRGGLSFRSQTGFVHLEGLLIEGTSLIDGLRFRGSSATTVTVQNVHIGPNGSTEIVSLQDGHADCLQTWGAGVKLLRISHATFLGGAAGRCLINAANTSGGGAVQRIQWQNSECVDVYGRRQSLVTNSDSETLFEIANVWLLTAKSRSVAAPELAESFMVDSPSATPLISRSSVGLGYVSPGYQ